jgi:hypothetical protein
MTSVRHRSTSFGVVREGSPCPLGQLRIGRQSCASDQSMGVQRRSAAFVRCHKVHASPPCVGRLLLFGSTRLSWLPYAIAFGMLGGRDLSATSSRWPAPWALAAGALLGVAAHLANVLPDLLEDVPHRGPRTAAPAGHQGHRTDRRGDPVGSVGDDPVRSRRPARPMAPGRVRRGGAGGRHGGRHGLPRPVVAAALRGHDAYRRLNLVFFALSGTRL